jgi:hypothetical protein
MSRTVEIMDYLNFFACPWKDPDPRHQTRTDPTSRILCLPVGHSSTATGWIHKDVSHLAEIHHKNQICGTSVSGSESESVRITVSF